MKLNEGRFAEIDIAVQEYMEHIKKYDAPISVDECINFICDATGLDYDVLSEMEDESGEISNMIAQYNESYSKPSYKHTLMEAKAELRKHGYILKKN